MNTLREIHLQLSWQFIKNIDEPIAIARKIFLNVIVFDKIDFDIIICTNITRNTSI